MSQKQDATLVNVPVGQHKNICSLEIDLRLIIWNVAGPEQYPPVLHVLMDRFLYCCPVSLAVFRSARNNQPIAAAPGQDLSKSGDQVFEPLVRCDVAEKQNRLFTIRDAQSLFCLAGGEMSIRNSIVYAERNDGNPGRLRSILLAEFSL